MLIRCLRALFFALLWVTPRLGMTAKYAAALDKPEGLSVTVEDGSPVFHWAPVKGAGVYRLAVWAAPVGDGPRPLVGAIWTRGNSFGWGRANTVAKLAKLPSTAQEPLAVGQPYRWMVAAARADGSGKSDWTGAEMNLPKQEVTTPAPARQSIKSTATSSPTPSATLSPTPTYSPTPDGINAEIEVDLGSDFVEKPASGSATDAAVLNVGAAEASEKSTGAATGMSAAKALLETGDPEGAETAYRAELTKDARNADAWEGLGRSYDARKLKLEAKEAFEKALAIDPKREDLKQWIEKNTRR